MGNGTCLNLPAVNNLDKFGTSEFIRKRTDVEAFVNQQVMSNPKTEYKTLPKNVDEMVLFLKQMEKTGKLRFGLDAIYSTVQARIDKTSATNLFFVFGAHHEANAQMNMLAELFQEGKDNLKVNGFTDIGLEFFEWQESQGIINCYLSMKDQEEQKKYWKKLYDHNVKRELVFSRKKKKKLIDLYLSFVKLAREQSIDVAALDMPGRHYKLLSSRFDFLEDDLPMEVREYFFTKFVQPKLAAQGQKQVVALIVGKMHAEKKGVSKYIPPYYYLYKDPVTGEEKVLMPDEIGDKQAVKVNNEVVNISLNGGGLDLRYIFDQALKKMGWDKKTFILELDGYREADYIVNVPVNQKPLWEGEGVVHRGYPALMYLRK